MPAIPVMESHHQHHQHHQDPSLLLLPPPPHSSAAALRTAYEPPLKAAIQNLKTHRDPQNDRGSVLFVGIVSPILIGAPSHPRAFSWPAAQSVLARVYSIVAVVCAQLSVPSEMRAGPGSIDVRVVLIDHDLSKTEPRDGDLATPDSTVLVDLPTFASAYRSWKQIFHVNSELGHRIFASYLRLYERVQPLRPDQLVLVESGPSLLEEVARLPSPSQTYSVVCLGGTFDHLHVGHKLLLTAAAILLRVPQQPSAVPARFIIGVTGDELLKRKKYAELVQPWDQRVINVIEFLASVLQLPQNGRLDPDIVKKDDKVLATFRDGAIEIHCVVLQDAFGPTTAEEEMDVLVVSGETRSGGDAVNARRRDLGWHDLEIFEVDVLDAEDILDDHTQTKTDFTTKISSTAIRERKAERQK
ncbi:cytidylyltransferase [Nemania sp. FL0916]|nr:cytidylyltransferase [Nemania sp. FL0916]